MNGVTIAQTMVVAEQRQAALPAELAGSLILAAADALASLALRIGPHELVLLEDGTLRICGGVPTDEGSAEASLRALLDRLLLSASSVTPALLRASRRPSRGNMAELVRELEVALIPTNRGAARRALARLCREVTQALQQFPQLQQTAEALVAVESTRVESEKAPVVAPAPAPALAFAPPPPEVVASEDIEILDFLDIELSPSVPVVSAVPVAVVPAVPVPPRPAVASPLEIPDLEIPGISKAELVPAPDWQPVEHTVKLNLPVRTSPAGWSSPPCTSRIHSPLVSAQSAAIQLEYVELSDDDVREATIELPPPPKRLPPPKPPLQSLRRPAGEPPIATRQLQTAPQNSAPDYQTAEPFLLVVPALGHAALATSDARVQSTDLQGKGDVSVPQRQESNSHRAVATAELPRVALDEAKAPSNHRENDSSEPAESGEQPRVTHDEASALAAFDSLELNPELSDFVIEPSERLAFGEPSELGVEPSQSLLFGEPFEFTIEPSERLFRREKGVLTPFEGSPLQPPVEAHTSLTDEEAEPVLDEAEHTVLDVVTSVGDNSAPLDAPEAQTILPEPSPAQFVPLKTLDEIQPINWRPVPVPELPSAELGWLDEHEDSERSAPVSQVMNDALEPASPPLFLEPHRYSAQPRRSTVSGDVESRVAQFSVREPANNEELNRGLRSLAGLLDHVSVDPSATPPPTTYTAELAEQDPTESKSPLARTLIGLGAVGTLFVMASIGVASHGRVASAATNPVTEFPRAKECVAVLNVSEVPMGATVRVTQMGRRSTPERMQVGQSPMRIDGLACGIPAELLVKVMDRGWYRIPVEASRLTPEESPEPVRAASFIRP